VELSEQGNQGVYFKVLPRYKYRQEGERVLFRDQIVFMNMKTNLYLHFSSDKLLAPEETPNFPVETWRPPEPDRRLPRKDHL